MLARRACLSIVRRGRLATRFASDAAASDAAASVEPPSSTAVVELPIERKSVVRGLVCDKIDQKAMVYPEIMDIEELSVLEGRAKDIANVLRENVDSAEIDATGRLPANLLDRLADCGAFAMQISAANGGLGLSLKDYARLAQVIGSSDLSVFVKLMAHNDLVAFAVGKYGSDEQKARLLPRLATGELVGSICLFEQQSQQDIAKLKTTVSRAANGRDFLLNGEKCSVIGARDANVFIVFASSTVYGSETETPPMYAFLVDLTQSGLRDSVQLGANSNTLGLRGLDCCDVVFKDLQLSKDSILGEEGDGYTVAMDVLESNRFALGAAVVGLLKRLIGAVTKHCHSVERYSARLSEHAAARSRMRRLALNTFVLESMTYYVAGVLDEDAEKRFDIENCMIHRFALRALRGGVWDAMEILGSTAATRDSAHERMLRDAISLSHLLLNDDSVTASIAMSSLTAWADQLGEHISQFRNKTKNTMYVMKTRMKMRGDFRAPKLRHYLNEVCHPSLENSCRAIEESMARMETTVTAILEEFGQDVEHEHMILDKLADCFTRLFAMVTVVARANRSYGVGLKNADAELLWAHVYCDESAERVRQTMTSLADHGRIRVLAPMLDKVSESVFLMHGYEIANPLERNW